MSFSINYLIFCVPTLHINDYRNRDIVLNALIAELITLGVKHHMSGKVPKSKDFYKVPLCSNTIVSTWAAMRNRSPPPALWLLLRVICTPMEGS